MPSKWHFGVDILHTCVWTARKLRHASIIIRKSSAQLVDLLFCNTSADQQLQLGFYHVEAEASIDRWKVEMWAKWTLKPTRFMLGLGASYTFCPYSCCFWQWWSAPSLVYRTGGCLFGAMPIQQHRYAGR